MLVQGGRCCRLRRRLKERSDILQSMVDSQVEAEGWEAPPEAALDRGSLHAALQARIFHSQVGNVLAGVVSKLWCYILHEV